MSAKKWIKIWVVTIMIIPLIASINFIIDPYYVFHKEDKFYKGHNNIGFIKVEYLKENKDKYNSYMMGSSRIGTTNPKVIEKYIKDSSFYNFYLAGANLDDIRIHLEYMIREKFNIKNLYLQIGIHNIDNYKFNQFSKSQSHPNIINKQLNSFYLDRLFSLNYKVYITKYKTFLGKWISHHQVNIQNGVFNYINRDRMIKEDHDKYIKKEKSFFIINKREKVYKGRIDVEKNMRIINNICNENNINLIVFITPHSRIMLDNYDIKSYLEFLKTISKFNNFYNFSGYNSVTKNDYNYYEKSHYLSNVGTLIAARIFNDKSIIVPTDFGIYVTKNNIDEHLKNMNEQIIDYDKKRDNK